MHTGEKLYESILCSYERLPVCGKLKMRNVKHFD